MHIIIRQPLWKTGGAFFCYGLLALILGSLAVRSWFVWQDRNLSREQVRLFVNTTRNLCLPLTLIKVPLEYLYEKSSSELVSNVLQQIKGVNNLLAELENISRVSAAPGRLSLADYELSIFLKETVARIRDYISEKDIMLRWTEEPAFATVCLDKDKMSAILRNLLMAFTDSMDRGGEILLSTSCNNQKWELRLESEDNGFLKKKFSGILSVPEVSTGNSELLSVTGMLPAVKTSEQKRPDKKKEKHSLVLVERNKDLCNYLVQILMKEYKIVSVCDAEAAFETVCEQCPDAVLASSVLTRISGEELAVRIKSDDRVAHIPVILLVKPGEDDRYIQRNADLYVWMPFAISSLKTEIAALIANREMIRKRYIRLALGGEASDPIDKEVESSEGDREFIRQVRSLIEERMTDSGFKIGELSDCMNMSRSSFYNKIKEITGHAPADYVRNVRLNRALVLLMSRKYTVAEVADMTGFSDPKYFGIVFKKYYGGSPTKYINNL